MRYFAVEKNRPYTSIPALLAIKCVYPNTKLKSGIGKTEDGGVAGDGNNDEGMIGWF